MTGPQSRYLEAAERTGDWLLATAERGPQGWSWPVKPGASAEVDSGLGWGTAGPVMFFAEAFRTTGERRWLDAAREGVRWMDAHLDDAGQGWAGCGLLTGVGGWTVVLHELATGADDEPADRLARQVLETVAHRATVTDEGVHWHDLTITSRVVCTHLSCSGCVRRTSSAQSVAEGSAERGQPGRRCD